MNEKCTGNAMPEKRKIYHNTCKRIQVKRGSKEASTEY